MAAIDRIRSRERTENRSTATIPAMTLVAPVQCQSGMVAPAAANVPTRPIDRCVSLRGRVATAS